MPAEDPLGDLDGEDQEDEPFGPIGPEAVFTLEDAPLSFEEFVARTSPAIASRPRHRPVQQPPAQPKDVIWQSRRPV